MKKIFLLLLSLSFLLFSSCSKENAGGITSLLSGYTLKSAPPGSVDEEKSDGLAQEVVTPDFSSMDFNKLFSTLYPEASATPAVDTATQTSDEEVVDDGRYEYGLSQPTYGITVDKNVEIPMPDGTILRGDVYRPDASGRFPVIMAYAFFPRHMNVQLGVTHNDMAGVGNKYGQFEQANPQYWVPRGYVYVTFNPRNYGGSQGFGDVLRYQEAKDYYDAIEWAAQQSWSDGNIGLFGISYYAFSQYWASSLKPPHLKAIVPWEGLTEPYHGIAYRGGIPSIFGLGFAAMFMICANDLSKSENYWDIITNNPLYNDAWLPLIYPIGHEIQVPMLSVGNLNDPDLHLLGNVAAFREAPSPKKKLILYSGTHWGSAYQPWANRTVLRFLDHWLKGVDTGIYNEPAVDVQLRTAADTFTHVYADAWPLPQTQWTKYYLDAGSKSLSLSQPQTVQSATTKWKMTLHGIGKEVKFSSDRLTQDVQIAGPVTAHFWVSSSKNDVDLLAELRDFDENGKETRFAYAFHGARDEVVSRGWLRASLRALDPDRARPHEPAVACTKNDWLTPGVPVAVDIQIWPTSMVFKKGHAINLTIRSGTYQRLDAMMIPFGEICQPDGTTLIYTGGEYSSWLELPVIPAETATVHRITINEKGVTPASVAGQMGDRFEWTNAAVDYYSVTEDSGLGLWDSQLIRGTRSYNPETWWTTIAWAGTFVYRDRVYGALHGEIAIPVGAPASVSAGSGATIVLGTSSPPAGKGFDVQLQKNFGAWSTIASGVNVKQVNTAPLSSGRYAVRARLRSLDAAKPGASGWSPLAFIIVN